MLIRFRNLLTHSYTLSSISYQPLNELHRSTKFYDQNVTGQWAHVSGLFFQADFESGNHFSLSGLVLAVQNTSIFTKFQNIALLERLQF